MMIGDCQWIGDGCSGMVVCRIAGLVVCLLRSRTHDLLGGRRTFLVVQEHLSLNSACTQGFLLALYVTAPV